MTVCYALVLHVTIVTTIDFTNIGVITIIKTCRITATTVSDLIVIMTGLPPMKAMTLTAIVTMMLSMPSGS